MPLFLYYSGVLSWTFEGSQSKTSTLRTTKDEETSWSSDHKVEGKHRCLDSTFHDSRNNTMKLFLHTFSSLLRILVSLYCDMEKIMSSCTHQMEG